MKHLYQERLSTPGLLGSPHCAVVVCRAGIEDVKQEVEIAGTKNVALGGERAKGAGQRSFNNQSHRLIIEVKLKQKHVRR
jgi:hypothetical protein